MDLIVFYLFYILGIQYINSDEIFVTTSLFLDKEFDSFVKNSVYRKLRNVLFSYL